jgi:uncharacterized spore protein YtfJ
MQNRGGPSVNSVTEAARDALTVRRVFGEAYVSGDTTIIPVAKVMGGSGMGYGAGGGARPGTEGPGTEPPGTAEPGTAQPGATSTGPGVEGEGGGGGFGVRAKPAGVYVVREGSVQWQPAIDVNRLALGGQILVAVAVLAWAFRRRR